MTKFTTEQIFVTAISAKGMTKDQTVMFHLFNRICLFMLNVKDELVLYAPVAPLLLLITTLAVLAK